MSAASSLFARLLTLCAACCPLLPALRAKPRKSSPRGRTRVDGETSGGDSVVKRVRAGKWSSTPDGKDGKVPWPESRKTAGGHAIGRHGKGTTHRCDYPGCNIINDGWEAPKPQPTGASAKKAKASSTATPAGATTPAAPTLPAGLTTRPTLPTTRAKGKRPAPRDPSPAPSEGSNASERGGSTKLYCMECYDPNNVRLMNFHEDCFNRWHCLGPCTRAPRAPTNDALLQNWYVGNRCLGSGRAQQVLPGSHKPSGARAQFVALVKDARRCLNA